MIDLLAPIEFCDIGAAEGSHLKFMVKSIIPVVKNTTDLYIIYQYCKTFEVAYYHLQ